MSGVGINVWQQSSFSLAAPDASPEQRLDGDEFDRSLRRLELPQRAPDSGQPAVTDDPLPGSSHADPPDQWSDVTDAMHVDVDDDVPVPMPNDELLVRQDGVRLDSDTVLEVSALHCLSAPGIAAIESLPGGSTTMTLHDFTSLLERTGAAVVSDGEQAWRFTLQDSALMVSHVALTRGDTCGHWSVALTVQGDRQPILSPHLQRLRERLEALGQGVTQVIVSREEMP